MGPSTLQIKELYRSPHYDSEDRLIFTYGVNLLVGPGNTGKTKWLSMLDYLMGDKGKPEEAFTVELAEKYDSISARFSIDQEDFFVERRWKEVGSKGKVYVDGEVYSTEEFQRFLLNRLKIPVLHFPKGNPYEERSWPELSWRTLLRHIYRQQRFWSDISDRQTETEQFASLMQFLGLAEYRFSGKSGELVEKRKKLWKLQGAKEQYLSTLDQIAREVSEEKELQGTLTYEAIELAIDRLHQEIHELQAQRELILSGLQNQTEETSQLSVDIGNLGQLWANLQTQKETYMLSLSKIDSRLFELDKYTNSLQNEISRLERAKTAGEILGLIEVTSCPVCDQPIKRNPSEHHNCYLCGQSLLDTGSNEIDHISNEVLRLVDEKKEAIELISHLSKDRENTRREVRQINERLQQIENQLTPVRQATSSILMPEIGVIDMEKGRLQQRIQQLTRIKSAITFQDELSNQIDDLTNQIGELDALVKKDAKTPRYSHGGDLLSEGMNSYVNALETSGNKLWEQGRIKASLNERGFGFSIEDEDWKVKLGGTHILYFLLSYHYALLNLTNKEYCHYPGLVILDLPPTFAGTSIKDKENFIIEPFIRLAKKLGNDKAQVIITGSAFEGLEGVNKIELTKVWK